MPDPDRWRRWVPRLAVESLVVVFGILLALVVNEWRQEAEREERREHATAAIRADLLHNYRELRAVHPYHADLADTLLALASSGAGRVDAGVRPRGWTLATDLVSAAWAAARSSRTTSDLPYPLLLTLSRAYEEQARFQRNKNDLTAEVLSLAIQRDRASLLGQPGGMAGVLSSIAGWEALLLREYGRALESLGVPRDSLEEEG